MVITGKMHGIIFPVILFSMFSNFLTNPGGFYVERI